MDLEGRGTPGEVDVADLVSGDVRTLDLMADFTDDRDALLTNLLHAEAIEGLKKKKKKT